MITTITKPIGTTIQRMWKTAEIIVGDGHVMTQACRDNGGVMYLPLKVKNIVGKMVDYVLIPPQEPERLQDRYILTDLQLTFDRLCHLLHEYNTHWDVDPDFWTRQICINVRMYWSSIMYSLLGKGGMMERNLFSIRVQGSFRGVTSHCPWIRYDEVALPEIDAKRLANMYRNACPLDEDGKQIVEEDPWVVLFRQPALHGPSFRKLKIRAWDEDSIGMSPVYTEGMNADFDGDWAFVVLGHPDIKVEEDIKTGYSWDHEMLLGGSPEIDFENFEADQAERIVVHPFSLCYNDIFENTGVLDVLNDCATLDVPEIRQWAIGIARDNIRQRDKDVSLGIAMQKLWIGMIGNFAKMMWLIADQHKELAESFGHIIETASQELFDSKHKLSGNFMKVLNFLEGKTTVAVAKRELFNVFDRKKAKPFFTFMTQLEREELTIRKLVDVGCPVYTATSRSVTEGHGGLHKYYVMASVVNRVAAKGNFNTIVEDLTRRLKSGTNFIKRSKTVNSSAEAATHSG